MKNRELHEMRIISVLLAYPQRMSQLFGQQMPQITFFAPVKFSKDTSRNARYHLCCDRVMKIWEVGRSKRCGKHITVQYEGTVCECCGDIYIHGRSARDLGIQP